jgi:hypothetical protein
LEASQRLVERFERDYPRQISPADTRDDCGKGLAQEKCIGVCRRDPLVLLENYRSSNEDLQMVPNELRDAQRRQPFLPFRLVMTDGIGYEIRHPDLLWVGQDTAHVGLTGKPGQTFFERAVYVDLSHIVRLEPLEAGAALPKNGSAS